MIIHRGKEQHKEQMDNRVRDHKDRPVIIHKVIKASKLAMDRDLREKVTDRDPREKAIRATDLREVAIRVTDLRSEERRGRKECYSQCRSRGKTYH